MTPTEQLLTSKELAAALGRSLRYVRYMRARGFPMPGNTATLNEARAWLARNPPPRGTVFCASVHLRAP